MKAFTHLVLATLTAACSVSYAAPVTISVRHFSPEGGIPRMTGHANGEVDDYYDGASDRPPEQQATKKPLLEQLDENHNKRMSERLKNRFTAQFARTVKGINDSFTKDTMITLYSEYNAEILNILYVLSVPVKDLTADEKEFRLAIQNESKSTSKKMTKALQKDFDVIMTHLMKDPMATFALLYTSESYFVRNNSWLPQHLVEDVATIHTSRPPEFIKFVNNSLAPFIKDLHWSLRDRGILLSPTSTNHYDFLSQSPENLIGRKIRPMTFN